MRWPLLVLAGLAFLLACGGDDGAAGSDAAADETGEALPETADVPVDVPDGSDIPEVETAGEPIPIVTDCSHCHAMAALRSPIDDPARVPKDWCFDQGLGLWRSDPAIPDGHIHMALIWTERGQHSDSEDCGMCHPVDSQGIGHGLRVYPFPDKAFEPASSCAASCHSWLPEEASTEGFENELGIRPTWSGSLRPADLLQEVETGHTRLWREGARVDGDNFRITGFNPGCGGCHNVQAEAHGTIVTCTGCHRFGDRTNDLHQDHIALIAYEMDEKDPFAVAEDLEICAYCHARPESPLERHKSACYNCHLSGHQPGAVLWTP